MTTETPRKNTVFVCLALALACLAVYGRVFWCGFINFDDNGYVYDNPWVRAGLTRAGLVWAFTTIDAFYWQPLTWLSHMLDCQLFGLQPGWHHLTNLLFHSANSVLVFVVFRRLTGALWRSAALAAIFALHPLRVETVAWVSERNDVLSVFWLLLALLLYQWHAQRPHGARYFLVLAALIPGLMSKPLLMTVPFLLLLLDWWPLQRTARAEKLPLVPLAFFSWLITYVGLQRLGPINWGASIPLPHRAANALVSYVSYLRLSFWPDGLALPYPYRLTIPWWQTAAAALFMGVLTLAALWYGRERRYLAVGWLWFMIGLFPAIGLVQVGRQAMADRFTYLPSLGLGLIIVWGGAELLRNRPALAAALCSALLIACGAASWHQVAVWHDSISLFSHTLRETRANATAERHLAAALEEQGRFDQALPHYAAAVQIEPGYYVAQTGYALALQRRGDLVAAAEHFRAALRSFPDYTPAQNDLNQLETNRTNPLPRPVNVRQHP